MRRLAMVVLFVGLIATAPMGFETSSRAAGRAESGTRSERGTALDHARTALPLPRAVAVAPPPVDPAVEARRRQAEAARARSDRNARLVASGDVWAALARCESGGNPAARSANGRYFGAFQFSLATWRSVGFDGNPADHSYEAQLAAAQRLQARSGWGQWPRCSRRLGLR